MHIGDENHLIRVAVVRVGPLGAEGGDLQGPSVGEQRHRAVLQAGVHHPLPGEHRLHLFRRGGGGNIPVMGLDAQQGVPDAAAYRVALPPCALKGVQGERGVFGDVDKHDRRPPGG